MALVGILSTQILIERFITRFEQRQTAGGVTLGYADAPGVLASEQNISTTTT